MTDTLPPKVLAFGASGRFAGLVVPELVRRGAIVRGFVRDQEKADRARAAGAAEIAIGDLRDPASLKAAFDGIEGVFYISPVFVKDETELGTRVVAATAEAGVKRFVFSSLMNPAAPLAHHAAKLPIEAALRDSGMAYTILQPAVFFQNLSAMLPAIADSGRVSMPYSSRARIGFVDYRDVAEVAAIALTDDRLAFGSFELCAEAALDRHEIAAMMSEATGREIEAAEQSPDEWARTAMVPDAREKELMRAMFAHYDAHGFTGNTLVLAAILGRPPRRLGAFLGELATA